MKRIAKNLPDPNWEPPVGAWESQLPQDLSSVICYLGCQGNENDGAKFRAEIAQRIRGKAASIHAEYAKHTDRNGDLNTVAIIYFKTQGDFSDWQRENLDGVISSVSGGAGIWSEPFSVTSRDIETLFSSDDQTPGIAQFGSGVGNPIQLHGYYGSMRDRLHSSNESEHASDVKSLSPVVVNDGNPDGAVKVQAPTNICAIRSGQDWSNCQGEQRDFYINDLMPVLQKGMDFLRANPIDTGCISCRFMTETDENGNEKDRTFGYALFKDIADLEAWAKSHPTHLAIFDKFMEYAMAFDNNVDLRLWHEVLVMPKSETFSYLNCAPDTGLLPYFK